VNGLIAKARAEVDDMAMPRLFARESQALTLVPPIVVRDEPAEAALIECWRIPQQREQFLAVTARRRVSEPVIGARCLVGQTTQDPELTRVGARAYWVVEE